MDGLPPLRRLLDPRSAADAAAAPLADAVNIPLAELGERLHELPARGDEIQVADLGPCARQAVEWLREGGRHAVLQPEFSPGSPSPGRLWRPNAFLEETLPRLGPPGLAVDLGCGSGREAVALSAWGWSVRGIDLLPDALAKARDLERRTLGEEAIEWIQGDLEHAEFDCDLSADLVTSFSYLHRPLLALAAEKLRQGGSVVVETFTATHRGHFGKPRNEAFVLAPGELPTLLPGLVVRHFSEEWREEGRHTARLWASRQATPS